MWLFDHLPVPDIRTALPGPNGTEMLARDKLYVSPSYTPMYPLFVERGSGAVVQDVDGNLFLDFTAGIAVTNTGHCHPEVVAAIKDQAEKLLHMSGTDFYYRPQIDLAERLAKVAPGPSPKKVFFANSGAEAIEGALKLARWHTNRNRVVAFFGAFHGRTYGAMSLSGSKLVHRRGFSPLVPDIHHVNFPRTCPEGAMCADKCRLIAEIEDTIFKRTCPPEEVAAIFVEPIQGEGGYHPIPQGCLPALRQLCDKHGILLVVDEVQSGMGRTGKMFAVEHYGVEPDIVCSAKGIASGMPLGAIIAKASVMDWPPGSHASTFGGNPVACRAALATIDLLEREYMANATARGEQLRAGLRALGAKHSELTGTRGLGLMTAADLPSGGHREKVIQGAFRRGLLLLGCGETAIRFCPPLCITAAQVETCLRVLDGVLGSIEPARVAEAGGANWRKPASGVNVVGTSHVPLGVPAPGVCPLQSPGKIGLQRIRTFGYLILPTAAPGKSPGAVASPSKDASMSAPPPAAPPPEVILMQMAFGKAVTQALSVAARFKIADQLVAGPKSAAELAAATGLHAGHLYRVLRALAGFGVFAGDDAGKFSLTPIGNLLRSDVPGSARPIATYVCDPWSWKPWGDLAGAVKTGQPVFDRMFGEGVFDYFAKHPDEAATFNEGMTGFSQQAAAAVLKAYDFSKSDSIIDVGGGHGSLLLAILKANPGAKGIVFDAPPVAAGAAEAIRAAGLEDRCKAEGGDFFKAVPSGDLIVMKNIIHDWNDAKATTILKACRPAIKPSGKLLLVELVVPAGFAPHMSHILDLEMMVLCDGKERTEAEYRELLAGGGFKLARILPAEGSPFSLVEAVPV